MRTLTAPTDEQLLHFQAWRATALQIMPYMGSLLFSFRPVDTGAVDAFGVDEGHRCYINSDKVIPIGAQFGAEALLHEWSHLLAEHAALAVTAGVTINRGILPQKPWWASILRVASHQWGAGFGTGTKIAAGKANRDASRREGVLKRAAGRRSRRGAAGRRSA